MSAHEIEIALAEIYDKERVQQEFIAFCEAMEAEYGGLDCPNF